MEARSHFTRCTRSLLANASCDSRLTVVRATRDAIDARHESDRHPPLAPSPGEIKRREVSWTFTKKLAQKRPRAGRWSWTRERVGLLLLQLFPSGGATNIVFVTPFCIAVGTATAWCGVRCAMLDGHCLINILLFWRRSTAALVSRVGACFEVSLFCRPFPFSHSSLIGLLASVDVKQQSLSLCWRSELRSCVRVEVDVLDSRP